jgi:hypothetical protein
MIELDSRFSKCDLKEQKKKEPLDKEILHTILDGKFETIPFGKDPYKGVEIGKWTSRPGEETPQCLPQGEC